ncbi:TonB-dependent siderophore receptor [Cellvibrio sp. NN19]|uniref:TonB-dependent siderophore receptor n=1 Tax=Cellvibrio chitinivorans TaxID=3102792 RepID=UPI002B40F914|nr:TonB-dependent siderophore receptor [Cellvibrio sp. NN19]
MKFKLLPLSAAVLLGLHAQAGLAQGTAKDATKKNANETEEVVVTGKYSVSQTKALDTATGLGLTIAETPQSVSVLTFERMQDQNITSILEAVNNAVGVTAEETDNVRNGFYSRGFAIDSYQIDGVPTSWSLGGDSGETVADTVIYERIEFVRGATGLMTGVGDPSASINLVRKHASSKELTGYLDVGTGSWDKRTFAADVGTGLNESGTVRARLVGRYQGGESFVDYYEDDKSTLYGVLEADLTDATLVRVGASYQNNDPTSTVWGVLPGFFSDGTRPDWDVSKTTAREWNRWESTNTNYFVSVNHTFNNGWELLANYNNLHYETEARLLYVYGSLDKATGAGLNAQRYRSDGESKQDSYDFQLKGDFNLFNQSHDFVVGALRADQSAKTFTQLPLGGDMSGGYDRVPVTNFYEWDSLDLDEPEWDTTRTQSQGSETEQEGYYAATRLSATDKLKFILGGRVATWKRNGFDWSGIVDYGVDDEFIPYAGALYDLTDAHRIYASYTEIFKPQNNRNADGNFIDPLVGESAEIGLKSRFLDDRLQTTVAYFDIQQDNLAQLDNTFTGTPEQMYAYIGVEGAQSKGFEIEVVGQPIDGWNISAGYTQFTIEDANGNDLNTDNATKSLKLFTSYEFGGALDKLMVGGGVNWQNETYSAGINPAGQPDRLTQEAYALVSLMARYNITDDLSAQFNAANVTDEKYYSQVGYFSSYRYGTPRNYTISLNYKF